MSKRFNLGFLAGAAWAAGIVGDAAERAVNRPPSPDCERDGPRVRESAAEVLGVASELILANAEAALGDCDNGTCLKCETCGGTTKEARGFCFEALVSTERARP